MTQEQAVHNTTLISGYHVSAAKNHVSSEKLRELNCIRFHSSSMLHNTLEWKSNVNFKCSSKLQFQGNCFHTNNVANITLVLSICLSRFYLLPILPQSVELWLIFSTLTI